MNDGNEVQNKLQHSSSASLSQMPKGVVWTVSKENLHQETNRVGPERRAFPANRVNQACGATGGGLMVESRYDPSKNRTAILTG